MIQKKSEDRVRNIPHYLFRKEYMYVAKSKRYLPVKHNAVACFNLINLKQKNISAPEQTHVHHLPVTLNNYASDDIKF